MARAGKPKWYPRKNWSQLADSTRKRYTRHGITSRNWYTKAGQAKVTEARGHGRTPERPERAMRNPQKYPEYVARRVQSNQRFSDLTLEQRARARKQQLFASRIGWSRRRGPDVSGGTDATYRRFIGMTAGQAEGFASTVGAAKNKEHDTIILDGKEYELVEWEWLLYH